LGRIRAAGAGDAKQNPETYENDDADSDPGGGHVHEKRACSEADDENHEADHVDAKRHFDFLRQDLPAAGGVAIV
jgi:hypothetical protein